MSEPHLILFDCDGTIVDSEALIVQAMTLAFENTDLEAPSSLEIRRIIGLSLPKAIAALGVDPEPKLIDAVGLNYRESYAHLRDSKAVAEPLFDGAIELIEQLSGKDEYVLGIATGKTMKGVHSLLGRHNLERHFVTLQTGDTAPSKPHPGMITRAMAETGIDAGRAIMIGDTTFDMEMAKNAGINAIGVTWGHHPKEDLLPFAPTHIVDNMEDIVDAISQSFSGSNV